MEIERKFKIKDVGKLCFNYTKIYNIKQVYLVSNEDIRVRKKNDKYTLTVKSKSDDCVRKELECNITEQSFNELIKGKHSLDKVRFCYNLKNDLIAEIDVYEDERFDSIVEVEFKTLEDANSFKKPQWFGEEITGVKEYKNMELYKQLL